MNPKPISTLAALFLLASCQSPNPSESETRPPGTTVLTPSALAAARSQPVDFSAHVKPILAAKCVMCHNHDAQPGKMDLSSQTVALRTGAIGLWIIPGKPDQSLLLTKTTSAPAHLKAMPPVGEQITTEELSVLKKWVAEGADWPSGKAGLVCPPK